jgi:riboflavin kinase/FMN adenylyltransferase
MRIFTGLETVTKYAQSTTVAIGSFDGVHLGHQALIRRAAVDAQRNGRPLVVFTFDRHPAELLRPDVAPERITTAAQRAELIGSLGADDLVIARFDPALAEMDREMFLQSVLKDTLFASAIVEGKDFCFGRNRAGDLEYLRSQQKRLAYIVEALDPVEVDSVPVSSSRIRERIATGDIAGAEKLLGHPYLFKGTVVRGQQLGRQLGYPTANLSRHERQIVPADGIYAVLVRCQDGRVVQGACSIGWRPTVEGAGRSIEIYLLDFNEDLYDQELEVRFKKRLREELKFASLDELKVQIEADVILTRQVLSSQSIWTSIRTF